MSDGTTTTTTTTYDAAGNPTGTLTTTVIETMSADGTRIQITTTDDGQGNRTSTSKITRPGGETIVTTTHKDKDGTADGTITRYDANGHETGKDTHHETDDGKGTTHRETTHFDGRGHETGKTVTETTDDGKGNKSTRRVDTDARGLPLQTTVRTLSGDGNGLIANGLARLDAAGGQIERTLTHMITSPGQLTSVISSFGPDDRLLGQEVVKQSTGLLSAQEHGEEQIPIPVFPPECDQYFGQVYTAQAPGVAPVANAAVQQAVASAVQAAVLRGAAIEAALVIICPDKHCPHKRHHSWAVPPVRLLPGFPMPLGNGNFVAVAECGVYVDWGCFHTA
jgi:hypothetical protein